MYIVRSKFKKIIQYDTAIIGGYGRLE